MNPREKVIKESKKVKLMESIKKRKQSDLEGFVVRKKAKLATEELPSEIWTHILSYVEPTRLMIHSYHYHAFQEFPATCTQFKGIYDYLRTACIIDNCNKHHHK